MTWTIYMNDNGIRFQLKCWILKWNLATPSMLCPHFGRFHLQLDAARNMEHVAALFWGHWALYLHSRDAFSRTPPNSLIPVFLQIQEYWNEPFGDITNMTSKQVVDFSIVKLELQCWSESSSNYGQGILALCLIWFLPPSITHTRCRDWVGVCNASS